MRAKLRVITWDELVAKSMALARKIEDSRGPLSFDAIVAVARGGLVVARLLSDLLGVKRVASLQVEYYTGVDERGSRPVIVGGLGADVEGLEVLLVDDVADTGETLRLAAEHVRDRKAGGVATATLYVKPWCRFRPDYFVEVVEEWVVFPYEHCETARLLVRSGWSIDELAREGLRREILSLIAERET